MRQTQETAIVGPTVVLVPYRREHVARYHAWMEDPDLRESTASERLTLQEEYAMQQSWALDEDKGTFIILDKAKVDNMSNLSDTANCPAMIGDVNVFLEQDDRRSGELEVMIARADVRRKGRGREALLLFMQWCCASLDVQSFMAKVGLANSSSLALFKQLGFWEVSRSEVFHEACLQCTGQALADLLATAPEHETQPFQAERVGVS